MVLTARGMGKGTGVVVLPGKNGQGRREAVEVDSREVGGRGRWR